MRAPVRVRISPSPRSRPFGLPLLSQNHILATAIAVAVGQRRDPNTSEEDSIATEEGASRDRNTDKEDYRLGGSCCQR